MRARFLSFLAFPVLLAAAGCDDGPKIVKVSGVATRNGTPVPGLRLTFQPDKGRPSWGDTGKDGRFTLEYDRTTKGAQIGPHTVTAKYQPMSPDEEMGKVKPNPLTKEVDAKYSDAQKGALKIEIKGSIDNLELKFD